MRGLIFNPEKKIATYVMDIPYRKERIVNPQIQMKSLMGFEKSVYNFNFPR